MINNVFHRRYTNCQHYSVSSNRLLSHAWDSHNNDFNFKYVCRISSCTSSSTTYKVFRDMQKQNIKSFLSNTTNSYTKFHENTVKGGNDYEEIINNGNDSSNLNETDYFGSSTEGFLEDAANYSVDKVDFNKLTEKRLLDLRENFNVTRADTYKISELLMKLYKLIVKYF